MRLKYLKLAGFKSFVDPTKIELIQALSAVVGPNGCGKSNIIDAVRWVLGESSAKNLRGEGMTDVIFNGSSARKPVSNASVELMFDNADGSAAGPWASFTDISIKRQVNRDGQSDYFVNGQKCRRRDISDLLSGTGLGPRSYAIIEQGTISRLVESKPHELRVFIEEAAGISKYKERKRDTENRIRHSRENLSRLADLRHELQGQIDSLETQAQLAQDYTSLKAQERELNQNIIVARWQNFFNELSQVDVTLTQQQQQMAQLESNLAQLHAQEKTRTSALSQQRLTLDSLNGDCHKLETDIARVQLSIEHLGQTKLQAQNKHSELAVKHDALLHQRQSQIDALAGASKLLEQSSTELPQMIAHQQQSDDALNKHESEVERSEQVYSELQHDKQRANSDLLMTQQGHEQLAKEHIKLGSQLEMLAQKQMELVASQHQLDPKALEEDVKFQQQQVLSSQQALDNVVQEISNARHVLTARQTGVTQALQYVSELKNRQTTLELIINQQTQPTDNRLATYYADHRQLWSMIDVATHWQQAAQTVLKPYLSAFVVAKLPTSQQLPRHGVIPKEWLSPTTPVNSNHRFLSQFIDCLDPNISCAVTTLCAGVYVADDIEQATLLLETLTLGESVVTPDGCWLSHSFCVIGQDDSDVANAGLLALKQQQIELSPEFEHAAHRLQESKVKQQLAEQQLAERLASQDVAEQALQTIQQQMLETKQRWLLEQQQWQHLATGLADVMAQHAQTVQLLEIEKSQQARYQHESRAHKKALATIDEQLKLAQSTRQIAKQQVKILQTKQQQAQQQVHQQQMLVQKHQLKQDSSQLQLLNTNAQTDELTQELAGLNAQQQTQELPLQQHKEQLKLFNQQLFSQKSKQQQQQLLVDEATRASAGFNEQWKNQSYSKDKLQAQIEKFRVKKETLKVKISAQQQALELSERELAQLAHKLDDDGSSRQWPHLLNDIRDKLAQMGAINLTAIEQYNEQKTRLDYLTEQNDDLEQGLKTLESAIRKIDRQSRDKFKATFDSVNRDFQLLFPKVFGGGSAQLTLTDSDLLVAGVSIMAQPPGKKNSTIALLSGGEKALTALSLVFAIFQLNPAPFCMLDEVDAPLDDANVDRFCNLVKEMSEKVQFIYITHNKVSMEMATQLTGVTMQEAGVSRVVTVDVDAAVSLAQQ